MFELIDLIIVRPIANILFLIYGLVGDFGLALILFTVLVKLLMWPLMKRQLHQQKMMRKIQPELAEIKKRSNGNRQLESIQMMDLYKRNNIKPFSSILNLIIQIPIFIALYTAIRVMVLPTPTDNLAIRAYDWTHNFSNISEVIDKQNTYLADTSLGYDFHPKLFGLINLDVHAGFGSVDAIIILAIALLAAIIQYFTMKNQMPTGKNKKTLRQLMKDAASGKEPDQSEINAASTAQMSKIMPIMMLFVMLQLPGAIVFYYFLINAINAVQQKIIFAKSEDEMEASADKSVVRELNKIKEAEIIKNKKTGTKITRITAKDLKKSSKKKRSNK
jgi:YidC/Oxa1 family membrane protein insertase